MTDAEANKSVARAFVDALNSQDWTALDHPEPRKGVH